MTELFGNFFKNKKVFVTGHTGFKGSWLSLWLTEMGAETSGYSLIPPTSPSLFDILNLKDRMRHTVGDIRDGEKLLKEMRAFKPEVILHLAAQPLVRLSYKEPALTYETNVMGTVNVLEAARNTDSVKTIVNITTDKCYENREWVYGYRENEAMGGFDPYSSSKGCSELVTSAYRNSFFNPTAYGKTHQVALASARAGNVIGGGDWAEDRLIPDTIKALSKNETIILRNPSATRPWQHVLEPLSGYLQLAAKLNSNYQQFGDGWNLGPYDEDVLAVEDVVKLAVQYWGQGKYEINHDPVLHEAMLLKLDISKAKHYLKWKPVYRADEAVKQTILWYKEKYQNQKNSMQEFTVNQIKQYTEKAKKLNIEWSKI